MHRKRNKTLGVPELIAIALGGMIGGGIFTVLGISVELVGVYTPVSIALGGCIAALAAYSYVKLGVYYKDEGATYSFYKRSFPRSAFSASLIGWWVIFGYVSTLALYAYTFASYSISAFAFADSEWTRKLVAGGILFAFTLVNVWSVEGMGHLEDLMVYTKLVVLAIISFVLINNSQNTLPAMLAEAGTVPVLPILIAASVTFVAYEGFQLVINAVEEMDRPEVNIPKAVYAAIFIAMIVYVIIGIGAVLAIPFNDIIRNKEYALAAGAEGLLGNWGSDLVVIGALLATSSAMSGTVFGASRQVAVIADDGYFPRWLARRRGRIPVNAIIAMSVSAYLLIIAGSLEVILEFGSITFLLVSLLMAFANHRHRAETHSSPWLTLLAVVGLSGGALMILYFELTVRPTQLVFILALYGVLTLGAWLYSLVSRRH